MLCNTELNVIVHEREIYDLEGLSHDMYRLKILENTLYYIILYYITLYYIVPYIIYHIKFNI